MKQRKRPGTPARPLRDTTSADQLNGHRRQHGYAAPSGVDAYVGGLKRRRALSQRLSVLDCGRSDPWHDPPMPVTDHQLDGWVAAAETVLATGVTPIIPVDVRRSLWRRGGADRVLAERLHKAVVA